jgi:hypothetical protein
MGLDVEDLGVFVEVAEGASVADMAQTLGGVFILGKCPKG